MRAWKPRSPEPPGSARRQAGVRWKSRSGRREARSFSRWPGGWTEAAHSILLTRISAIVERGTPRLVLECEELNYINSTGLRAVLIGAKTCRQAGGKLAIAALGPQCRSVMEMSGFLSVIDYRETREAALDALA